MCVVLLTSWQGQFLRGQRRQCVKVSHHTSSVLEAQCRLPDFVDSQILLLCSFCLDFCISTISDNSDKWFLLLSDLIVFVVVVLEPEDRVQL